MGSSLYHTKWWTSLTDWMNCSEINVSTENKQPFLLCYFGQGTLTSIKRLDEESNHYVTHESPQLPKFCSGS